MGLRNRQSVPVIWPSLMIVVLMRLTACFSASLAVKVIKPARMRPRLLIGPEGDILAGSFTVKVSEPKGTAMSPF